MHIYLHTQTHTHIYICVCLNVSTLMNKYIYICQFTYLGSNILSTKSNINIHMKIMDCCGQIINCIEI